MKRFMMFLILAFELLVYSTSVLQAGSLVKKAPAGILKMTVLSSTSGKPLARVKITARMGRTALSAITDTSGYAQISLPASTWKVGLGLKGWQAQSNNVRIKSGYFTAYKITLYPAGAKPTSASWIPSTGGLVPGRV